ncbi:Hsp20/alpha crystallin family protein [Halorubraceae archaeon YAN]|nr:Hsp20/alpha crystallin family protein [Halorubraceae archaeon YAN]
MMRRSAPFDEIEQFFERMSRNFEQMGVSPTSWNTIDIDIADYDTEYVVMADVPGFDREHIDLRLDDDMLTIRATRDHTDESEGHSETGLYLQRERHAETLNRRIRLPEPIDAETTTANYTNGVLTVTIPKLAVEEDEDRGHRIDIS